MHRSILLVALAVMIVCASPSTAQQASPSIAAAIPMDQQWGTLAITESQLPSGAGLSASNSPSSAAAMSSVGAAYVQRANALHAFYTANPSSSNVEEAMLLEAKDLVYAQIYGITTQVTRCNTLVAAVRDNAALPVGQRFSLASIADMRGLVSGQYASEGARLAAYETEANNLIQEFPAVPDAYRALLTLGLDCDDAQAIRIFTNLLSMPAPSDVLSQAQIVLNRYALVGKSLSSVLGSALPASSVPILSANGLTVVYSWSETNVGTIIVAQQMASLAPPGATFLGVNTDTDVAGATAFATSSGLPGTQLFDPAGLQSNVAQALYLSGGSVVFIADTNGKIVSVSGRIGPAAKLQAAETL